MSKILSGDTESHTISVKDVLHRYIDLCLMEAALDLLMYLPHYSTNCHMKPLHVMLIIHMGHTCINNDILAGYHELFTYHIK